MRSRLGAQRAVASDLYRFADVAPAVTGSQPTLSVNGQPFALDMAHGSRASVARTPGDRCVSPAHAAGASSPTRA